MNAFVVSGLIKTPRLCAFSRQVDQQGRSVGMTECLLMAQSGHSCARLQPRTLLSIARLNMARSRVRPSIC